MDIADLYRKRKEEQTSKTTEKPSSAQTPTASKPKSITDLYNERRNGVSASDNASAIESAINDLDKRMNQYVESYNTSLRSAQGRYSDRGNKYVSDTAEYLKMMQEMQKNANTRATTLRADMEKYKDYINEDYYKTALANLDAIGKGYADFVDYASKDNEFYGQFNGDEELYNRYFNSEQKDLGKIGNWQPSGKSGMEDLAVRQLLGDKKQEVTPSEPPIDLGANMSSRGGILKGNDAPLKSKDNPLQILSKPKEIKEKLDSVEGGGGGYDRETKKITASPILTPEETAYVKLGKDLTENAKSDEEFFKWVALGRQEADNYTLNKRTFNAPKSTNANDIPRNLNYTPTDAEYYGEFLTDEEKDIYAYYLAKEKAGLVDKGTADEYLYALAETSNARRADFDYTMQLEGNPAYELAFGLSAGTEQFFRGMSSWFDNRDYIPSTANEIMSGKVREDLAKFGDLGENNINGSSLGQVLYDTITTTSNMLPSIVLSSVTAGAGAPQAVASAIGSIAMGASAGGQARRNMLNAGYSQGQATLYGILDGACEAYLQNVLGGITPLGNGEGAFGGITEKMLAKIDNAAARVAIKLGGSMASEGLEESLQEVIEPWLYSVITNTDFDAPTIDQVLYAGLLGAVSSVFFEGGSTVGEAVQTRNLGKAIQTTEGGVARLKKIGSLVDPESVAGELVGRVNEFTNPYTIGRLYNEIGAEFNEQTVGDITERLVEKGVPEIFAKRLANGMANVVNNGAELNAVQAEIIAKNSVLADVLREKIYSDVTPNEITEALINRGVPETEARTIAAKTANNGVFGRDLDYIEQFVEENPNTITFDDAKTEDIYLRNRDAIADVYAKNEANAPVSMQLQSLANRTLGIDDTYAEPDIDSSRAEKDNVTWRMRNDVSAPKGAKVEGINQQISTDVERNLQTIAKKTNQSYTTPSEAFLNEIAKQYGYNKQTAEQFVKYYDERVSPEEYASDFNRAYWAARIGIKDTNTKSSLNQLQTRTAQSLAEIDRNVQTKKTLPQGVTYDGKVKFADGKTHKLNTTQRANFSSIEKIVKTTKANSNVDVKVFESVRKGNKRVLAYDVAGHKAGTNAPNGFYDPNTSTIYIDLYAGNNGEGAMLWTFAHELVHYVRDWKVSAFNKLADFVVSELSKTDVSVESLIEKKMREQRGLSYDGAYEEVIADSLSEAFTSDFNAEALAEKFNAIEDKGLLAKIKEFFLEIADVLKGLYAKLNPQTTEARIIREHQLNISKMASLLVEGATEAGAAEYTEAVLPAVEGMTPSEIVEAQNIGELNLDGDPDTHSMSERSMAEGAGLIFDYNKETGEYRILNEVGKEVSSVTTEQMKNSPLGDMVTRALDNGFISKNNANKQYKFLTELMNLALDHKSIFSEVWEIAGTEVFSAIKSNSDKQYSKTVDFSTVCKKTQAIIDAISETQKRLKRGLTKTEIRDIVYEEVGKAGEPTPCPVCYVFSRWMGVGGIIDNINKYTLKYNDATEEELLRAVNSVEDRVKAYANEKKKADFFDADGNVLIGKVIADMKSSPNGIIKRAVDALALSDKNAEWVKLYESKLADGNLSEEDRNDYKDKIKELKKKILSAEKIRAKEDSIKAAEERLAPFEEYQFLTRTFLDEVKDGDEHIGWKKNDFHVDDIGKMQDVIFDLNKGAEFATNYPQLWTYRTTRGCNAGKAILPYSDARVGETVQGIAFDKVKDIKVGESNPFLNGDTKAADEYIKKAINKARMQNLIGGTRYQSTSDFRFEYGSDYLISFLEMQAIGSKVQLYTKVIEAVDFFASVGAEVNMSVMPLSDGFVTLEDGRKQLMFSSVTGINPDAAIAMTNKYDNAQLILVGISDEHIRLAMSGDDVNGDIVSFIIPFHASGNSIKTIQTLMNELGENLDLTKAQDYSAVQEDHRLPASQRTAEQNDLYDLRMKILTGDAQTLSAKEQALLDGENGKYLKDLYRRFYQDENADEYGVTFPKDIAEKIFPYEYWDKSLRLEQADENGRRFVEYCKSMGIVPRFSGIDSSGNTVNYGNFVGEKGYWKLLIDRRMYNRDGTYHNPSAINVSDFKVDSIDPRWATKTFGEEGEGVFKNSIQKDSSQDPVKTSKIADAVIDRLGVKNSSVDYTSPNNDMVQTPKNKYSERQYFDAEKDIISQSPFLSTLEQTVKETTKYFPGKYFKELYKSNPQYDYTTRLQNGDATARTELTELVKGINSIKMLEDMLWYPIEAHDSVINYTSDGKWVVSVDSYKSLNRKGVKTYREIIEKRKAELIDPNSIISKSANAVKGKYMTLGDVRKLFDQYNDDADLKVLADKVFDLAPKLHLAFRWSGATTNGGDFTGNANYKGNLGLVQYAVTPFNDVQNTTNMWKASAIVHELIHASTTYLLDTIVYPDVYYRRGYTAKIDTATLNQVKMLNSLYWASYDALKGQYARTNLNEFVAEAAKAETRKTLADIGNLDKYLVGIDYMLSHFDSGLYTEIAYDQLVKGSTKYSTRNSDGETLSEGQIEYFKDSKVRDKDGNLLKVYHGTNAEFYTFDFGKAGDTHGHSQGFGFYLTPSKSMAEHYGSRVLEAYANLTKPMSDTKKTISKSELKKFVSDLVDYEVNKYRDDGMVWRDTWISNYVNTYEMSRQDAIAQITNQLYNQNGDDINIIYDIANGAGMNYNSNGARDFLDVLTKSIGYDGMWVGDEIVVFNPEQIKLTSNRNPTENQDIRYSTRNSQGEELSKGQQEYFKDSKVRDADGNLLVMYHGTNKGGFTVFDPSMSDDKTSLFFTNSKDMASSYVTGRNAYRDISKAQSYKGDKNAPRFTNTDEATDFLKSVGFTDINSYTTKAYGRENEYFSFTDPMLDTRLYGITRSEFLDYASNIRKGGTVYGGQYAVYLNITNPLVVDANEWWDKILFKPDETKPLWDELSKTNKQLAERFTQLSDEWDAKHHSNSDKARTAKTAFIDSDPEYVRLDMYADEIRVELDKLYQSLGLTQQTNPRKIAQYAKAHGYDGVILRNTIDYAKDIGKYDPADVVIAFNSNQVKLVSNENPTENKDIRYSERITNPETLKPLNEQLEKGEFFITYKAMVNEGTAENPILYSPMANKVGGKQGNAYELGYWYESTERPDLAQAKVKENGKNRYYNADENPDLVDENWKNLYFVLNKGVDANGKPLGTIKARYNPYEHSSNYVINDQFKGAYKRDNLVVVEMLVPKSEAESGYRAKYAKDAVGWTNWKTGKVGSALAKEGKVRQVMLSRYAMPNRVLSDAEVAEKYAELLMGTDIAVPKTTVTKGLRAELEKLGVPLYSQRGVDNRTILANALDSTASSEVERDYLRRYKAQIKEANADEKALADIKSQIKDLMFSKGKRDMEKLNSLINKSKILQEKISKVDKQLLKLESTAPIKRLLQYETDRIYKETVKDLKENYKENAEIRDVKTRIKAIAEDFRGRLLNTTKSPIPRNLINGAIAVATLIDPTGVRQDTKVAQKFANTRQALLELKSTYDNLSKDPNPDFSSEFDEEFSANIQALADAVADTPVRDMTEAQLTDVYNILNDIRFMISTATRQLGLEERITNYEAAKQVIEETEDIVAKGLKPGAIGTFFRDAMTNPMRAVREMYAYNEDARMVKTIEALNEGRKTADAWKMEQTKVFDALREGKDNTKAYNDAVTKKVDMGLVDINGESAPITKMQAMMAILTYRREIANENRKHLATPALFPDIDLELKGKYEDALLKGTEIMVDYDSVKKMEASLTEWDKEFLGAAEKFFNTDSQTAINETTMQTKGRPIANEKAYIPYYVNKDYVAMESQNVKFDKSILNEGILKSVKKNAPQQVIMTSLNKVLTDHIEKVGNIYGLSIPVRNYNKLINTIMTVDDGGKSVKTALGRAYGKGGYELIDRAFADAQAKRPTDMSLSLEKALKSAKSSFVMTTLASNLSVWMKQAASYPTAGSILSAKALAVGLKDYITKIKDGIHAEDVWNEIDEHTAQHYIRRKGLSMQELGEIKLGQGWQNAINTKLGKLSPLNWIQSMDVATTAALWYACKAEVRNNTDIEVDSDEYWSEVTKLYEKVLEETQPMYDPLHRAEVTKAGGLKNIILFQTQPLQNSGILREATYNLKYATKQFGKDSEEAKAARTKFGKAVASQVASHVVFTLMTLISSALLHRMSGWDDENKEVTAESVMENFGKRFMDSAIGAIFPVIGGYATSLYDAIDARINGKQSYTIISDATVDKLNSTIDKFLNAVTKIDRAIKAGNQGTWEATYKPLIDALTTNLLDVATYLGIPATNLQKIIQAIHLHAKDIANNTFLEAGTDYTTGQSASIIYSAMLRNDDSKVSRYYDYAMADGVSDSSLRSKLKYNIEMSLFKNEITADEATDLLKKAYELTNYNYGDIEKRATKYAEEHNVSYETARETLIDEYYIYWDMQKMLDDDGEYTKYDKLWTAVESGKDLKTEINTLLDHHISSSTIASQITSHYKERYSNASTAEKASLQGYLINAYVLLGYSYDDAKKKISKW